MTQSDLASIPIVDFSRFGTDFDRLAEDIKNISEKWGFLYLKNHDIDQTLIDRIFDISNTFFNKTSQVEKDSCPYDSINNAGYDNKTGRATYFQEYGAHDKVSVTHPKEDFTLRKDNSYDQPLPPTLQDVKPEIQDFMHETHEKVAVRVLACISAALGLSKNRLPDLHQFQKPAVSTLRLIHYPPYDREDESSMRLPSHTDHGVITVLFQHKVMGLQVRPPQYTGPIQEGEVWIDAPVIPGTILINIGETMTFFSGGRMKSTLHRVARSPRPEEASLERFSTVYFCHANEDTLLKVLDGINGGISREPPISCVTGQRVRTVKDWIQHRHSIGRLTTAKEITA